LLFKYCQDLRHKSDRYRLLATSSIPARGELDEHRAIFEAAIARQFERAVELLCSHYTITQTIIEGRFNNSC
jgi:DNA-binding GntR family transcriptional regulator